MFLAWRGGGGSSRGLPPPPGESSASKGSTSRRPRVPSVSCHEHGAALGCSLLRSCFRTVLELRARKGTPGAGRGGAGLGLSLRWREKGEARGSEGSLGAVLCPRLPRQGRVGLAVFGLLPLPTADVLRAAPVRESSGAKMLLGTKTPRKGRAEGERVGASGSALVTEGRAVPFGTGTMTLTDFESLSCDPGEADPQTPVKHWADAPWESRETPGRTETTVTTPELTNSEPFASR